MWAILQSRDRLISRLRATRDALSVQTEAKETEIQNLAGHVRRLAMNVKEVEIKSLAELQGKERVIAGLAERIRVFEKQRLPPKAWRKLQTGYMQFVSKTPYRLGVLKQYAPRPLQFEPPPPATAVPLPGFCILTPSFGQGRFIETTLRSVLDQGYPKLRYGVQDGGSKDETPDILQKYSSRMAYADSRPDKGQADAINFGFKHMEPRDDEIMAWLNSDDLLPPGTLHYVGEYFARHPEVDAVYGHRIIIDEKDREIGRWFLPHHDDKTLKYADYVPQETLFWRASAYNKINGLDPTFQFAMDWDFLLRLEAAKCTIVRLPRFLGCFRVHEAQKTSSSIHDMGALEMRILRTRFHGRDLSQAELSPHVLREVFRSACVCHLWQLGLRY